MPCSTTWDAVKREYVRSRGNKGACNYSKHSGLKAANETLQEYILQFTDLAIHTTGADPTSVTC